MFQSARPTDAATHDLAIRIARRSLVVIENLLRPEERRDCLTEFYLAARAELEKPPREEEV